MAVNNTYLYLDVAAFITPRLSFISCILSFNLRQRSLVLARKISANVIIFIIIIGVIFRTPRKALEN